MSAVYRYKVRVGVILVREDKLLLVRQNNKPFWVFPGGTLEPEEGLEECAVREMKEEINLDIRVRKVLYIADFLQAPEPGSADKAPRHTIDIFMLADYLGGVPMMALDENLNDMAFFSRQDCIERDIRPEIAGARVLDDWSHGFANANGLYIGKYGA
jgi:ADP-ribose pyrophosphatase YjhB (NUDIX family)